jgi:hypothetical protein
VSDGAPSVSAESSPNEHAERSLPGPAASPEGMRTPRSTDLHLERSLPEPVVGKVEPSDTFPDPLEASGLTFLIGDVSVGVVVGRPGLALVALSVVEQRLDAVRAVLSGASVSEVAAGLGTSRQTVQ